MARIADKHGLTNRYREPGRKRVVKRGRPRKYLFGPPKKSYKRKTTYKAKTVSTFRAITPSNDAISPKREKKEHPVFNRFFAVVLMILSIPVSFLWIAGIVEHDSSTITPSLFGIAAFIFSLLVLKGKIK